MASKVFMCGEPKLYVPDDECSECLSELEKFKSEVHDNYYTKSETSTQTEINELIAASADGGFKVVDSLPDTGDSKFIYLVPIAGGTGYEQYIWTDSGWVDIGKEEITLDKQSILTALGYEEIQLAMTDVDGNEHEWTILAAITTP